MAIEYKPRNSDGTISGKLVKIGSGFTLDEKITSFGEQLAQEKMKSIQKDFMVNNLGEQLAQEKMKSIQKEIMINNLGEQLAQEKMKSIKMESAFAELGQLIEELKNEINSLKGDE